MLVNILLLILFVIILLNKNIIEGQSDDNDDNEENLNPVNKLYNVMLKLFDEEFNISKIVEEDFSEEFNKYYNMYFSKKIEYEGQCYNDETTKISDTLNNKINLYNDNLNKEQQNEEKEQEEGEEEDYDELLSVFDINVDNDRINMLVNDNNLNTNDDDIVIDSDGFNELNNILNSLNMHINDKHYDGELSTTTTKEKISHNVCDMVDILYNSKSDDLKNEISNTYGECYIKNDDDDKNTLKYKCKKSCHIIDKNIIPCARTKYDSNQCKRRGTYIEKNGLYYNCLLNRDTNRFTEQICKPINNICNKAPIGGSGLGCKSFNSLNHHGTKCGDYFTTNIGTNKHYNCTVVDEQCVSSNEEMSLPCFKPDEIVTYDDCES
jgi:hypothetical protein